MAPVWVAQLATGAKSFRDNPLIGSPALNRRGLHERRMRLAHDLAWRRRARLAGLVSAEDRAAFDRDGFVMRRNFLPDDAFRQLRDAVFAYEAPAREMIQGDTITRRIAVDPQALAAVPELKRFLANPEWRGINRYVGSFDQEPLTYVQTILSHVRETAPDPQTDLHADTFHPTVKAWLFLTDVAEDEGPFVYVAGSHRLTPGRLAWERETSVMASESANRLLARGSFRAGREEIARMGYGAPKAFAVPANTLVAADTVGFHARGLSARPTVRVEIWTYGRRNPFLPWTGLDAGSIPGVAERRIPWMWRARDLMEKAGLGGQPWHDVGRLRPADPPGLQPG
ncbi:phytanoyl-CoA dioxygenase [Rhizobiales bacterium L72]|uniref:Phytanoyl-CoA dioxygenase n=2 Tax=Propylenella binzhouense TaxID=2555902 RepID=A0A964WT03_9HYPH|nr:phytanoyl-CoA dioxygenase family protein [Propylenella binzhouense]MYZ47512.1 phytanoyl-CoA dioxygenase [Propylenella binzhouense]